MKVQSALSREGYYRPIDGVIGPDGVRAIRAFQEAQPDIRSKHYALGGLFRSALGQEQLTPNVQNAEN
jgi:peptidoglycan hydrolase-like protein with peptidoglycan-binding domain